MSYGAVFVLALGLSMDAMAVSAARGLLVRSIALRHVLIVALFFGGFQALMPLAGWFIGSELGATVQAWDHWIAFGLLSAIGARMVYEARVSAPGEDPGEPGRCQPFGFTVMLALAVATSIDALAAGVTLPMLNAPLLGSLCLIGLTTAVLSALGLYAGRRFGPRLGRRLDALGGGVLIALGTKILIEHLVAG